MQRLVFGLVNRDRRKQRPVREGYNGYKWIRPAKRWAIYWRDRERHRNKIRCVWCSALWSPGLRLTLDHLTPWVHGGGNEASNLITACVRCNSKRKANDYKLWIESNNLDMRLYARIERLRKAPLNTAHGAKLFQRYRLSPLYTTTITRLHYQRPADDAPIREALDLAAGVPRPVWLPSDVADLPDYAEF